MDAVDDNNDDEVFAQNIEETSLKLPDVPIAGAKTVKQFQAETQCHDFVANVKLYKPVDFRIYHHLSRDEKNFFTIITKEYLQDKVATCVCLV